MRKINKTFAARKLVSMGFTLIELLVVMAILSVLVSIIAGGFRSSQIRGRDAERKSDFKQMANALELYYSDYGKYPDMSSSGQITACPYALVGSSTDCVWGTGSFTDGRTIYIKTVPIDPTNGSRYYYRVVDSPTNQKFQLFAHLENPQDQDCLNDDCATSAVSYDCGTKICNFSLTSPNTTPTE